MSFFKRIALKAKTFFQLGPCLSLNYLLYQIGLRSGYFKLVTPASNVNMLLNDNDLHPDWFMDPPDIKTILQVSDMASTSLFKDAEDITKKKMCYFGGDIRPLQLTPEKDPVHWTRYETGSAKPDIEDIKFIWEPARFNWAITLGKAYFLHGNEKFSDTFWQLFEEFADSNPPNRGLNWTSAQEVALRLIALVISGHIMMTSSHSTPERLKVLAVCIANHADRIPPTLCYARAQNNNHLVSEAVGLFTAATFLPGHPHAAQWRKLGLKWFNRAVLSQVAPDGTYIQHSTNYQRLFLTLALWMNCLVEKEGDVLQDDVLTRLALATEWLAARLDNMTGRVPNLGHNDGSYFLPLSICAYDDYRPVVQAASRVFLAKPALPPGQWDDLSILLDIPTVFKLAKVRNQHNEKHLILGDQNDWAALRAVTFNSRPAHADQLHVDIWHAGENIAMDAGTFQYNAAPPWQNALAATRVHNSITINGQDQMTRTGKFLWLDWAQAEVLEKTAHSISALHFGYVHLGVLHRRTLQMEEKGGWTIIDDLLPARQPSGQPAKPVNACLNWLLPDRPYKFKGNRITLQCLSGKATLNIQYDGPDGILDIYREGKAQMTDKSDENLGWYSPTYGLKIPALSVQFSLTDTVPVRITSSFSFGKQYG